MNQLKQWMHAHPFKAVGTTFLATAIATFVGCNDHLFNYGAALIVTLALVCGFLIWRDTKKSVAVIALLAFLAQGLPAQKAPPQDPAPAPQQFEQAAAPVAVGAAVVVICVGAYCTYKLVKFCQRKFPKSSGTNAPPAADGFAAAGEEEYGASWNYGALGSCYDDGQNEFAAFSPASDEQGVTFTIDAVLEPDSTLTTRMNCRQGEEATQSWEQFAAEVRSHGLVVTGVADGSQYFSRNRTPCDPSQVPIEFDPFTKTVLLPAGVAEMRRVTVERSKDLVSWSPLLTTTVPIGKGVRVEDATRSGQMFYRLSVSAP
jgi:hypothetical protein